MNTKNALNLVVLCSVLSLSSVGCKRMQPGVTGIPTQNRTMADSAESNNSTDTDVDRGGLSFNKENDSTAYNLPADGGGVSSVPLRDAGPFLEDRDIFASEIVYFDYDSATVNSSEMPKLETVASYLQREPGALLRLEGHSDERGTDEYNRALGERRALSIREFLSALGVTVDRAETISYGEDRPAMVGSDEISWAKNRRGEFVVLVPKN